MDIYGNVHVDKTAIDELAALSILYWREGRKRGTAIAMCSFFKFWPTWLLLLSSWIFQLKHYSKMQLLDFMTLDLGMELSNNLCKLWKNSGHFTLLPIALQHIACKTTYSNNNNNREKGHGSGIISAISTGIFMFGLTEHTQLPSC